MSLFENLFAENRPLVISTNKKANIIFIVILLFLISGCGEIGLSDKGLEKLLGISVPRNYKVIKGETNLSGMLDPKDIYTLEFEPEDFDKLIKAVENSPFYNFATKEAFDTMAVEVQLNTLKELAKKNMASYWIKTDSFYFFDSEFIINANWPTLHTAKDSLKIMLPPDEKFGEDKIIPVYSIKAEIDFRKRTLSYHYIHI
ncbi:MAG: hypothetical protein HYX40_00900 [Sphingobacteriales bacterium]|nr:hypothetical protein [Sphingobacteriales bacterium]